MSGAKVAISDDYAALDAGGREFYYGYERTNEDGDWLFQVRSSEGVTLFERTTAQLGCDQFDDTAHVLLRGIGAWIEERER